MIYTLNIKYNDGREENFDNLVQIRFGSIKVYFWFKSGYHNAEWSSRGLKNIADVEVKFNAQAQIRH